MPQISAIFASKLYRAEFASASARRLIARLETSARVIAVDDEAGQAWCKANDYRGYTSYASLDDLTRRDPIFADLERVLDRHVAAFADDVNFDLAGRRLALDSIWINLLSPGGHHGAHIHPHAAVSGTLYLVVPKGAGAIRFEDPRLPHMMAAPPRKAKARLENRTFVSIEPKPGTLLLWESFLRHEVPANHARSERISVSFNYRWD